MTDDHGIQSVEKLYAGVVDDLLSHARCLE
jgi:hypothetical protein